MKTKSEKPISLRARILRFKELVKQGANDEALDVFKEVEKSLKLYGVKPKDFFDSDTKHFYPFKVGSDKLIREIFFRCFYVFGLTKDIRCRAVKKTVIYLELTALQYVELSDFFYFHKENYKTEFNKMKKMFAIAYIHKHNLYTEKERDVLSDNGDYFPISPLAAKQLKVMVEFMSSN